jgi:hypothetical protein
MVKHHGILDTVMVKHHGILRRCLVEATNTRYHVLGSTHIGNTFNLHPVLDSTNLLYIHREWLRQDATSQYPSFLLYIDTYIKSMLPSLLVYIHREYPSFLASVYT